MCHVCYDKQNKNKPLNSKIISLSYFNDAFSRWTFFSLSLSVFPVHCYGCFPFKACAGLLERFHQQGTLEAHLWHFNRKTSTNDSCALTFPCEYRWLIFAAATVVCMSSIHLFNNPLTAELLTCLDSLMCMISGLKINEYNLPHRSLNIAQVCTWPPATFHVYSHVKPWQNRSEYTIWLKTVGFLLWGLCSIVVHSSFIQFICHKECIAWRAYSSLYCMLCTTPFFSSHVIIVVS